MTAATMRIMSYNTLFGGFDGMEDQRYQAQIGIILDADPDILLTQELKGFLDEGGKRLFEMERRLERRALIAPAPVTGQNTAIFVKPGIEILAFEADSVHFHHAAAIARLRVPGFDQTLTGRACRHSWHGAVAPHDLRVRSGVGVMDVPRRRMHGWRHAPFPS